MARLFPSLAALLLALASPACSSSSSSESQPSKKAESVASAGRCDYTLGGRKFCDEYSQATLERDGVAARKQLCEAANQAEDGATARWTLAACPTAGRIASCMMPSSSAERHYDASNSAAMAKEECDANEGTFKKL